MSERSDVVPTPEGEYVETNRFSALSFLVAILALAVSSGAFGTATAAAGLPPSIEVSTESFAPGQPEPPLDSDAPSAPAVEGQPDASATP